MLTKTKIKKLSNFSTKIQSSLVKLSQIQLNLIKPKNQTKLKEKGNKCQNNTNLNEFGIRVDKINKNL